MAAALVAAVLASLAPRILGDDRPPNLVVIVTDDQTVESVRVMSAVNERLAGEGTTFSQAVASFPQVTPSEATLLTGRYAHNHGVLADYPPAGGYPAFDARSSLPVWLSDAGYATAHVGRYLDLYGNPEAAEIDPSYREVPPGWDRWFATTDPLPDVRGYYDYEVIDDGEVIRFGDQDEDYLTDVLAERATDDLEAMHDGGDPFYLQVWTQAAHRGRGRGEDDPPVIAAPRHIGTYGDELVPDDPSIDEQDLTDKPPIIQWSAVAGFGPVSRLLVDTYRSYLESLLAVDELIADVIDTLEELDVIDETIIVFTSDNGVLLGQHRQGFSFALPYEPVARVPLVVRGPGFPAAERDQPVALTDVVPTLLEAAGVELSAPPDGEALQPFAESPDHRTDRAVLVANGPGRAHFAGIRTADHWYTEYEDGSVEYYDLDEDPYQLESRHEDAATQEIRAGMAEVLAEAETCTGDACHLSFSS